MARIYPFAPYELREGFMPLHAAQLRSLLEPSGANGYSAAACAGRFAELLENGRYASHSDKSLYIYRHSAGGKQKLGLWCRVDSGGLHRGEVLGHEQTFPLVLENLLSYRAEVGLDSTPVLLAYRPEKNLDQLLAGWSMGVPDFSFQDGADCYEFWRVERSEEIGVVCKLVERIDRLYIADGHHRMAAAAGTGQQLAALLVSSDQLDVQGYHRLLALGNGFHRDKLFWAIEKCWYRSDIPANVAYRPDRRRRMGMCLQGKWYQLDLKEGVEAPMELSDAQLLQETILAAGLGILDPVGSPQIEYYADGELPAMFARLQGRAENVAFTLFPLAVEEILRMAENGVVLPPKSTWVEPRAPYGLLIDRPGLKKGAER